MPYYAILNYLPSTTVTVTWFIVSCLTEEESVSLGLLPRTKPGCLGCGIDAVSLLNIKTTEEIVGLSSARSWTHIRPTCMHLSTSDTEYESANDESISSSAFLSLHSLHAYHNSQ